jgi:hypothetical protein
MFSSKAIIKFIVVTPSHISFPFLLISRMRFIN